MEALTERTRTDMVDILDMLARIRREGWAEEDQENEEGIRCIGAPILDCRAYPLGAVSVSAPAYRFDDEAARQTALRIRDAAWSISAKLGCTLQPETPPV